jgi:hypothetical protein
MHTSFYFTLDATDWAARAGTIMTPHGEIQTPIFMPVGTRSAVKWATVDQIRDIGSEIMLVNNYHSYLRPGCDVVESFGWLHQFMDADLPILTDSGGFQVFSLGLGMQNDSWEKLARVTEDGVHFRSYLDGSRHFFTPESVMDMQSALGADIIMAFDECAPGGSPHAYARAAMERTHRWALRSRDQWQKNEAIRAEKWLYPQAWGDPPGAHSSNAMMISAPSADCISMTDSGVKKCRDPSRYERKWTPSSVTRASFSHESFCIPSPRENTWNPPESVRIGRSASMNWCSQPNDSTTSHPGRRYEW